LAVRIYALAKELKLDSKVLVDLCPKAGVTGKGSALASLTEDEVEKIRAYLSGGSRAAAKPRPEPVSVAAPAAAESPTSTAIRREDYIAPGGVHRKPPVMVPKAERPPEPKKRPGPDGPKPPGRTGPAIKLAPLPPAQQPPAAPQSSEPAPQKPEIRLPLDAIRAGKAGTKPLEEHMRKHEERRKAEAAKKKESRPPRPGAPAAPAEAPPLTAGRDRGRKGARGPVAEDGEGRGPATLGGREQRQLNRKRVTPGRKLRSGEDDDAAMRSARRRIKRIGGTNTAAPRKSNVVLELPCTVRTFSEALGVPVNRVLQQLLKLGRASNINAELDPELAELLAVELGVEVDFKRPVALEEKLLSGLEQAEDDPAQLEPRPPIVTVLGHVDHGKTSLLDKIIGIDVVSGESGGITQHIRAYRVQKDGRAVAFVDTPGHEAFTEMRARGANVTDIAVLVVAADDGVMPQTEEAISHARAAGVPIVVALNKIDLHAANPQRCYEQLAANGLLPTEWGGETDVVKTSALTGQGIDDLLSTLLTLAELHDYKANPRRPATGTCLEAEQHTGRGVVAKLLVQKGTLHVGDVIVCGAAHGRVKAIYDTLDPRKTYQEVGPSTPVNVTGLDVAPGAGDHFHVLEDIAAARSIAEQRAAQTRKQALGGGPAHVTLENLRDRLEQADVKHLNLIVRADVRGSIEAIEKELGKLMHPEVQIKILHKAVGGITEGDVYLADASQAVIIGFNVVPDEGARALAEQKGVQIRRYDIIYNVTNDLKAALEGMLKPEQREVDLGRALVKQTFVISRVGTIAGCQVLSGVIERNARVRVIRESRIIGDYALDSLKRIKDDVREVRQGYECGIKLAGFNDLKEGDVLEAYKTEQVARTI
jgi:translation initiation factor IF-2